MILSNPEVKGSIFLDSSPLSSSLPCLGVPVQEHQAGHGGFQAHIGDGIEALHSIGSCIAPTPHEPHTGIHHKDAFLAAGSVRPPFVAFPVRGWGGGLDIRGSRANFWEHLEIAVGPWGSQRATDGSSVRLRPRAPSRENGKTTPRSVEERRPWRSDRRGGFVTAGVARGRKIGFGSLSFTMIL